MKHAVVASSVVSLSLFVVLACGLPQAGAETVTAPGINLPPVELAIRELDSSDGKAQASATKLVFLYGKKALEPLRKAGAKQVSPNKTESLRRIDMVYSLIDGLKWEKDSPDNIVGLDKHRLKLDLKEGVTKEDIKRLGEKYGFEETRKYWKAPRPHVFVKLDARKNMEDVIRALLVNEPGVNTVAFEYWILPKCKPPTPRTPALTPQPTPPIPVPR